MAFNNAKVPYGYSSVSFKDSIILGLLLWVDVVAHMRDFCRGNRVPIQDYPFQFFNDYLEELEEKKATQISSYYQLRRNKVFKVKNNEKIEINLNSQWWQTLFNLKFRYFVAPEKWDRHWTIVTYDIPENQKDVRRDIRKLLSQLGFVLFQRSVWITINDVESYIKKTMVNFESSIFCFKARNLFEEKDDQIIKDLFKPPQLEDQYKKFIGKAERLLSSSNKSTKVKLIRSFPELILADKGVPSEFFDNEQIRNDLWDITRKLQMSVM